MNEDIDFIPYSKDSWRTVDYDGKINRSSGVNSKKFHGNNTIETASDRNLANYHGDHAARRIGGVGTIDTGDAPHSARTAHSDHSASSPSCSSARKAYSKSMEETNKILRQAELRVDYLDNKRKFDTLQERTVYRHWPLQEPALQYLDELRKDWDKSDGKTFGCDVEGRCSSADKSNDCSNTTRTSNNSKKILFSPRDIRNDIEANNTQNYKSKNKQRLFEKGPSSDVDAGNSYMSSSESESSLWSLEPRIFATEKSASGKRKYIVCHLGRFMHHYWRYCEPSSRHFYELIREQTPCRLYFDLEYNKLANPDIADDENETLLNEFINELSSELNDTFGISISRDHVVDLDSSTEKKFSRHLIVHMPGGQLFEDAPTCGIFVKKFVGRIAEEVATGVMERKCPTLAKYLFVNSEKVMMMEEGEQGNSERDQLLSKTKTCFVDIGVYTRNRLFRLLGSSKFGKPTSAALRIASANKFPFPLGFTNDLFYDQGSKTCSSHNLCVGVSSGNSRHEYNTNNDAFTEESKKKRKVDWKIYAEALVQTFVIPAENNKNISTATKLPTEKIMNHSDVINSTGHLKSQINKSLVGKNCSNQPTLCKRNLICKTRNGPTMFPSLDNFIQHNLGQRKNIMGSIRTWTIEPTLSSNGSGNNISSKNSTQSLSNSILTYHMKDNRWCENINRSHKSNNIMWNISIRDGTYWQSCHDPDCRMASFYGQVKKLPTEVVLDINDVLLEEDTIVDVKFQKALMNLDVETLSSDKSATDRLGAINEVPNNDGCDNSEHPRCDFDDDNFNSALSKALSQHPQIFP